MIQIGGKGMVKKKGSSAWRALGLMTNIGITLAASVLIGYYIGYYLDKWIFHKTGYVMTMIFSLCGVAAGFRTVFRMLKSLDNKSETDGGNKE